MPHDTCHTSHIRSTQRKSIVLPLAESPFRTLHASTSHKARDLHRNSRKQVARWLRADAVYALVLPSQLTVSTSSSSSASFVSRSNAACSTPWHPSEGSTSDLLFSYTLHYIGRGSIDYRLLNVRCRYRRTHRYERRRFRRVRVNYLWRPHSPPHTHSDGRLSLHMSG